MNKNVLKSTFSLLNTDHVQLDRKWNYQNITSAFYRLYLIDGGQGKLYNPDHSFTLEKGYLYLIPSFTLCNYYCPDHLSQYYLSCIEESPDGYSLFASNRRIFRIPALEEDGLNFRRLLELNRNRGLHGLHNPKVYEKRPVLESFRDLNNRVSISSYIETCGILLQMISRFLSPEHFQWKEESAIHSKILDAINYIQTNLGLDLTVAQLAKRANQNADYFSRLFQENTGERPLSYIQFKRIERAQFLLSTTDLPFSEIAALTGFDNLSYFSRTFKKITAQTPGEYKRNNFVTFNH